MERWSWSEIVTVITFLGTAFTLIKSLGYDKRDREQIKTDVGTLKTETSSHYKDCNERREDLALLTGKLSSIEASITRIEDYLLK